MVGQMVDSDLGGKSSWESKGPTISFSISFLTDPDEFNMLMERSSLLRNFACNTSLTANSRDELNSIHSYAQKDSMDHIQMYFPIKNGDVPLLCQFTIPGSYQAFVTGKHVYFFKMLELQKNEESLNQTPTCR